MKKKKIGGEGGREGGHTHLCQRPGEDEEDGGEVS
jgi:hypothetical protein